MLPFDEMITKTIRHYISTSFKILLSPCNSEQEHCSSKKVTYFAIASTVIKPLLPSQITLDASTSNDELNLSFLYTEILPARD